MAAARKGNRLPTIRTAALIQIADEPKSGGSLAPGGKTVSRKASVRMQKIDEQDEEIRQLIQEEMEKRHKWHGEVKEEERKREMQKVFDQYGEKIYFLQLSLHHAQGITDNMVHLIDSFDNRIAQLEKMVLPLTQSTQEHKIEFENAEKTIQEIQSLLDIYNTASTYQKIVNCPPEKVNEEYFECLEKINQAIDFLVRNRNFKSSEDRLSELKTLKSAGLGVVEASFEKVLRDCSKPTEPQFLPNPLPERIEFVNAEYTSDLQRRINFLQSSATSNYLHTYKEVRGAFVINSIRKMNLEKMMETYASHRYAKGSHEFNLFITLLLRLLEFERELCSKLIPSKHFMTTFTGIIDPSIDHFLETAEALIRAQTSGDTFGVFILFDVWETLGQCLNGFQKVLDIGESHQFESISAWVSKLRSTLTVSFTDFEEELKHEFKTKEVPADGTVHEPTVNAINFLKRLFEYKNIVEELLPSHDTQPSKLANFVLKIIDSLKDHLEKTAKREKKTILAIIFLLNNYHYIANSIRHSTELFNIGASQLLDSYDKLVVSNRDAYKLSWNKAIEYLIEGNNAMGKKAIIKKTFKGFNAEFEEMFHTQKTYAIPDSTLRSEIIKMITDLILPGYKRFYVTNEKVNFSSNPTKYLKFSPETMEGMLTKFFEEQSEEKKQNIGEKIIKGGFRTTAKVATTGGKAVTGGVVKGERLLKGGISTMVSGSGKWAK